MTSMLEGSLVLYKDHAALVKQVADKLEIQLEGSKSVKVRPKDVVLLHPGPLRSLNDLRPQDGELQTAWELLAGGMTTLPELAELIYGSYTPNTAWSTWQLVTEGLYFRGQPDEITVRSVEQVSRDLAARAAKQAEEQGWQACISRLQQGQMLPEDARYLHEVEAVAFEQQGQSRILRELGRPETSESAHGLLLSLGHWTETFNPYPQRFKVELNSPSAELPNLPDEERVDLTHLAAFAIDDEGSKDPDDALSLEGERLWVHVADVAALITPDSPADIEARGRASNLYLPEMVLTMLPPKATQLLGLGLQDISPALSFGLDLTLQGEIAQVEIVRSWVKVTRLTYDEVEQRLTETPFRQFHQIAIRNRARREANHAVSINLPEVKVTVIDGVVAVRTLPPLRSRDLVMEAMLLAGEGAAKFGLAHELPLPFSTQPPPDTWPEITEGMAGMFALRMTMKRSQMSSHPSPHSGLGLSAYVQATSPLRRYLDLVVHQQIRAYLRGESWLDSQELLHRVGMAESVLGTLRMAERLSRKHWTLVYLKQNPSWQGVGVLVDQRGHWGRVIIPELGLENPLYLTEDLSLNSEIPLRSKKVKLAQLEAQLKINHPQENEAVD